MGPRDLRTAKSITSLSKHNIDFLVKVNVTSKFTITKILLF